MTSARQSSANRANAEKSTGPRTMNGKQRSSTNAYRHGLAAARSNDPEHVEAMTEYLSRDIHDAAAPHKITHAVEALLELCRARTEKRMLINEIGAAATADLDRLPELGEALRRLDRYEGRASSRMRRAMRSLV